MADPSEKREMASKSEALQPPPYPPGDEDVHLWPGPPCALREKHPESFPRKGLLGRNSPKQGCQDRHDVCNVRAPGT